MQGFASALMDFQQFILFNKSVSKLGSKSLYVSEFGKVVLTSTPAENSFFMAHAVLTL